MNPVDACDHPKIRPAHDADLDAIAELQERSIMASCIETYGLETCEAWARMGRQMRHGLLSSGTFFVAEKADALQGVAGWVADSREADCAWPRYVFVAPEAAGLGIGRGLMLEIECSVSAAGRSHLKLWSSLNAVPFYRALGFHEVKRAYWPIGGDIDMEHLLMEKESIDPA